MNYENTIEKNDTLLIKINQDTNSFSSYQNKSCELLDLKFEQVEGIKFRHTFFDNKFYFVVQDVYAQFGVKDPASSASSFHYNHKENFHPEAFKKLEFRTDKGKRTYLTATIEVVTVISARVNSDKGYAFIKATGEFYQKFLEGKISLSPSQEAVNRMLREWSFQHKLVVKDLDQIKSVVRVIPELKKGLEDLQFLINSQNEIPVVSITGTISDKIENIKALMQDTVQREGVHFNTVCNEFKKTFQLHSYTILAEKDYNRAIAWFNARQDKIKQEKNTVSKKGSNLDKWFKPEKKELGDYN